MFDVKEDPSNVTHYVCMGMSFGYPPCCIGEFVMSMMDGSYESRESRQLCGTGYVPCIKCNTKSRRALINAINRRRPDNQVPFDLVVKAADANNAISEAKKKLGVSEEW